MIAYASITRTKRNLAALRAAGWRMLVLPHCKPVGFQFAIDNGAWSCFKQGAAFDREGFSKLVYDYGALADWTVIPDVVAGGRESLAFSLSWIPELRKAKRLLLAVQDGMEPEEVREVLRQHPGIGLFLGGSTEWKLKTMYQWGEIACSARRWYHVARVNSRRRIRLAAESGADSFDGTSATRYAVTLPLLEAARQQPSLLVPGMRR